MPRIRNPGAMAVGGNSTGRLLVCVYGTLWDPAMVDDGAGLWSCWFACLHEINAMKNAVRQYLCLSSMSRSSGLADWVIR